MNWLYLMIGALCALAIAYAFGRKYARRLLGTRRLREAMRRQMEPNCFGGIRCTGCPGDNICGTGCFYQSDYYKGLFRGK